MKKDLEWLKKWMYEYEDEIVSWLGDKHTDDYFSTRLHGVLSAIKEIREKLNQLDEPEVLSQELPVIPRFVAEWIEDYKEREDIYTAISNAFEGVESTEMYNWVSGYTGVANQETFARAWLDGYEIEKEPKYEKVLRVGEMFFRGGGYKDDVFVLELSGSRNAHVFVDEGEAINIQSSIGGQLEEMEE